MGTKNNPGQFDCHAKADPDEPIFTLRAKDPSAPYLVKIWEATRRGDYIMVANLTAEMLIDIDVKRLMSNGKDCEKFQEAVVCADSMTEWRRKKGGDG